MMDYDALFRSSLAGRSPEIGLVGDDPDDGHGAGIKAFCEDVGLEWLNDVTRRWTLPRTVDVNGKEVDQDGRFGSAAALLRAIAPMQPLVDIAPAEPAPDTIERDLRPGQMLSVSRQGSGNYRDDLTPDSEDSRSATHEGTDDN